MVASSTQAAVMDLLVQKLQGLALTVDGTPVPVYDGMEGNDAEENFVCCFDMPGSARPQPWAYLGTMARYEDYEIGVAILCVAGGDDAAGASGADDAQLTARANCSSISDAIEQAILADVNLATQNGGSPPPGLVWVLPQPGPFDQEPPEADPNGEKGRYCCRLIRCSVKAVLT